VPIRRVKQLEIGKNGLSGHVGREKQPRKEPGCRYTFWSSWFLKVRQNSSQKERKGKRVRDGKKSHLKGPISVKRVPLHTRQAMVRGRKYFGSSLREKPNDSAGTRISPVPCLRETRVRWAKEESPGSFLPVHCYPEEIALSQTAHGHRKKPCSGAISLERKKLSPIVIVPQAEKRI